MKKLNPKKYRLRKVLDYTGVVLLVMLLLFIWQLYRAPIALPFLKPYIIKALNHDDSQYQVTLDSVNLELVRSIKPIHIIANNVVYKKTDGSLVVNAPKTSVSFSIKALLRGVIAPSSVEVNNPSVYVFTSYGIKQPSHEEITQKKLEYYFDGFEEFVERFNSEDKSYPESYINDIVVKNAEVEFHEVDLGRKWAFSDLNYRFERNFTNIDTEFNALIKLRDQIASVGIDAEYRPAGNKVALEFYFSDLNPRDLSESFLTPAGAEPGDLAKINLPLNGRVNALIDFAEVLKHKNDLTAGLEKAVEKVAFEFEGGAGNIVFAPEDDFQYAVSSFLLSGEMKGGLDQVDIKKATFDLGGQKTLLSFSASGFKDLLLKNSYENLKLRLRAEIPSLNFDDLYKYWPKYIATDAWEWCEDSIFGGRVKNGVFDFDFAYDPKSRKLAFQNLNGRGDIEDAALDYLTGMPRVTNIYGSAEFFNDKINILIDKGVSDGVIVNSASVLLYDLNKNDNFAKVSVNAEGSIENVLKLIDHKPLQYTSEMGLDPENFEGHAETDLNLEFELKNNLAPDEVKVSVKSQLTDVVIPKVIDNKNIEAAKLALEVNNQGLLVSGDTLYEGIPVKLTWDESFAAKNYKSRYKLAFKFDENAKKKLGLDIEAINPPFIKGYIETDAVITTYNNEKMDIDLSGSLKNAAVDYSFLGLKKPLGEKGNIMAKLSFDKNKLTSIPSFSLSKTDFKLNGRATLDKDGNVRLVDITNINGPRTSARAKIEFTSLKPKKVKINVSGSSYDLSDFFARDEEKIALRKALKKQGKKIAPAADDEDELAKAPDTEIYIAVSSLWTNPHLAIRNFAGSARLVNGIGLYEMHAVGNYGNKAEARLKLDYVPRPGKEYLISVESNDAGSTLKFLRMYDNMEGGTLRVDAKVDVGKNIVGHAQIRDFSIHNTPVLAKLLTVASFSGIVNMLTGEGLTFSHFDAPFTYQNKVFSVNDAKAFGNVLGITASGSYFRNDQELRIKGLIAPAYGLNTFIGKIPLVGSILSGKDGTVFAANYKINGDIDDPIVSINPLSALSPNSLKELMSSLFGSSKK